MEVSGNTSAGVSLRNRVDTAKAGTRELHLADLLVDVIQPGDLYHPSNVPVRQAIREEPPRELVPFAQPPTVDA